MKKKECQNLQIIESPYINFHINTVFFMKSIHFWDVKSLHIEKRQQEKMRKKGGRKEKAKQRKIQEKKG